MNGNANANFSVPNKPSFYNTHSATKFPMYFSKQRVSYRSSWYDTIIYGYFIHILGYVVVMAWVASILDKYGVKKL